MDSKFGLVNVWLQGDWVTRGVALLLLGMSLASWIVILIKALDILRYRRLASSAEPFWHSADFAEGLAKLGPQADNPFHQLAVEGREAAAHVRRREGSARTELHDALDVSDWVTRCLRNSIDDTTARLQTGLAVLASVGSTAPFIGLFGTVWGIYHALMSIGAAGQATIDKVAGPIGEALDHDRARAGGGDSRRAGLQRAGARQQAHPDPAQPLCPRPARLSGDGCPRERRRRRRHGRADEESLTGRRHQGHTMAFGTQDEPDEVMNEINMTPFVDVMLVLLIIFIITVPVMKHAVNVDLPRVSNQREVVKPETVRLSVQADGTYYWNESAVSDEALTAMLLAEAPKRPATRPAHPRRQGGALRARGPGHGGGAAGRHPEDRVHHRTEAVMAPCWQNRS